MTTHHRVSHRVSFGQRRAASPARPTPLALACASLLAAWLPLSAQAQTSGTAKPAPATAELDSVVIANDKQDRSRSVQVQTTPAAITSLSGAKLEEQGVGNLRELGNIVPNLFQPRTAVSYLNSSFFIRGIGEPDAQGEPSVAVVIDDLYWPKNLGANQELLDIDRVEVFRGPQGQEFGHSALGGVLRINSTVPTATTRFRALAEIGNYNDRKLSAAGSGALSENLFGSLALTDHLRGGFTRNVTVDRDTNDVNYQAGRGKLRWVITPDLEATLSLGGVRDTSTVRGVQNLAYGDELAHNQVFPYNSYRSLTRSLTVNYQLNPQWRSKLVLGTTYFDQTAFFDNTGDYWGRGSQLVTYRDNTWQGEWQLLGTVGAVDVTAGLYSYRESWFTNRRANTASNAASDPALITYRPVYTLIDQDTTVRAAYSEGKFKLSPATTLTAGLRYNWEEHSQSNQLYNLVASSPYLSNTSNFLQQLNGAPQALVWDATGVPRSWQQWQPKLAVDHEWRRGLLSYASYSEGSKSAGYDYRAQTTSAAGKRQAEQAFDPEKARNLEAGIKSTWLDGTLRSNVSAFYTRFDDIQITTTDPTQTPVLTHRFNAGKGSTRGLEFEGAWLPQDGLQFDFNGAFLRARLDEFTGAPATLTTIPASSVNPNGLVLRSAPFAGAELPYSPKFQGRLAATWRLPVAGEAAWVVNANVNYQTKSFTDATNNPTTQLPAQTYINGGISYIPAGSHWTVTLSGQNLANKRYALGEGFTAQTTPTTTGAAIYRSTNYNDPRTVTLALKYEL